MSQITKKNYDYEGPSWYRLKKLWKLFNIASGRYNILQKQKIAREILQCQEQMNLPKSNFDELLSIVLWE